MRFMDANAEDRRKWLRQLQNLPPAKPEPQPESDFEQSLTWKIGIAVACIAIALSILPPEPTVAAAPVATPTV
jgi:hypothetical protein